MNQELRNHPILQQMGPSPEQFGPIVSRGQDIVVTAGAGTGKTRTLVARYLSLLVERMPLRSIVAITFTKKAAREMRNRIREEVRRLLESSDLSLDDQNYWRGIYEKLDAARISTIHSLAADILHHHPAEMTLDPAFELLEDGEMARLKTQSVEAALSWAANDREAASLFITFGEWSFRKIINGLLAKRLEVQEAVEEHPDDLWELWQPYLIEPIKDFIENPLVQSGLDGLASLEEQGLINQAEMAGDSLVPDLRIANILWKRISDAYGEGDWVEISRCLNPLRNHLKQKGRKDNWAPANPKAIIKEIQVVFDSALDNINLDLALDQKLAQQIIPGLMAVFQEADEWYSGAKTRLSKLDYDDLEFKSLQLLRNFPSVKLYWQDQIKALLVDEFQDTNHRQRELVALLNGDNRNLFIVGDGKQSIYRFRGADVSVFREEQIKIKQSGESFQLANSYRAHPGLLRNLNDLLKPVLGEEGSIPYIEPFSPLQPGREQASKGLEPPYIELHLAVGSKASGALHNAARAAAFRLMELVESESIWLTGSGESEGKLLSYGDVAVLCRASGSFPAYEGAFEGAGIPYLTIAGQGFYDRPEIRDVLNALLALAEPENDLAMAGLLRSPAGGLSDAALMRLRDFQRKGDLPSLLEAARHAKAAGLGEEVEPAGRIVSLLDELIPLIGRITVAELLWKFLEGTAYIPSLTKMGLNRGVQNIKKLITDTQKRGEASVEVFLNTVSELRNVAVREGEALSVTEGAVQIMTVHQSKGLEFPVVVLGDASKRGRFSREVLFNERFGLVPPFTEDQIKLKEKGIPEIVRLSSLAYGLSLTEERLKEEAESNRLLYVAATRAQELLIISGVLGKPARDQSIGKQTGWLGKLAETLGLGDTQISYQEDGDDIQEINLEKNDLKSLCRIYKSGTDFIYSISSARQLEKPEIIDDFSIVDGIQPADYGLDLEQGIDQEIRRVVSTAERPTAPAWMVGEIVHRALEIWQFPDDGETAFISWAAAELQSLGISREREIKDGCRRVIKNLERFQSSDLYQRMTGADRLLHEIPFSMSQEGESPLIGVIDAMFLEDGKWVLVEFKTDRIPDQDAFKKLWNEKDYQSQVGRYLKAAETLLGRRPEPVLCFLNYEKRVHLVTDRW
jgi:ATP-dependent helicase/nuclease subunit A